MLKTSFKLYRNNLKEIEGKFNYNYYPCDKAQSITKHQSSDFSERERKVV